MWFYFENPRELQNEFGLCSIKSDKVFYGPSSRSIIWHSHALGINYGLIIKQRWKEGICIDPISVLYWKWCLTIWKMCPRMELTVLLTTKWYANIILYIGFYIKFAKNVSFSDFICLGFICACHVSTAKAYEWIKVTHWLLKVTNR